ncbi:hypothetical protein ABF200_000271, partial [Flavobacterium psychrophilum]
MKNIIIFALIFNLISCKAQEFEKISVSKTDISELYVNDENSTELFYYKYLPKNNIIGVLVVIPSGGELVENTLRQITLQKIAVEKGIMVIVPSINWGTDNREAE